MKNLKLFVSLILFIVFLFTSFSVFAQVSPTPLPGTGAYSINLSPNITEKTCYKNDPNCFLQVNYFGYNRTGEALYNTTFYTSGNYYKNLSYIGFDGNWTTGQSSTSQVIQPGGSINTLVKLIPPADFLGTLSTSLYVDGKTCTVPSSCYYYGGSETKFTINIIDSPVTPTATPSPTLIITPTPTASPSPTVVPSQFRFEINPNPSFVNQQFQLALYATTATGTEIQTQTVIPPGIKLFYSTCTDLLGCTYPNVFTAYQPGTSSLFLYAYAVDKGVYNFSTEFYEPSTNRRETVQTSLVVNEPVTPTPTVVPTVIPKPTPTTVPNILPVIVTNSLPIAKKDIKYMTNITAKDMDKDYMTMFIEHLPAGLSQKVILSDRGIIKSEISGRPTIKGIFTINVKVKDQKEGTVNQKLILMVR